MSRITSFLLMVAFLASCNAGSEKSSEKDKSDKTNYIFFLHNMFAELFPDSVAHPVYGRTEYGEILEQFRKNGFTVISERRLKNTDVKQYAQKVVLQVDSLLKTGVKPDYITIIGTSKGGYIAQYISTYLANPEVNFVFIGCFEANGVRENSEINLCGNILSIYERTDTLASSGKARKAASKLKITRFKELQLNTGLKHGFLYHPLPQWTEPSMQWARRRYDDVTQE